VESEGLEEKYRAVADGGDPEGEPVGQRWDLVEPALWGRRHSHTVRAVKAVRPRNRQPSGLGKAAGEGGWEKPRSRKSKVVSEDKFHA
jgi:hypothetical protein